MFGLKDAVRGLRGVGLDKVVSELNRDTSKDVQAGAQAKLLSQPVPKKKAVIGRRATATSATVVLRYGKFPWAAGAEFGAIRWRQFRPWVGNQHTKYLSPGYMIGATLKEKIPTLEKQYRRRILDAIDKAIR